jgi:hypothetical protein
MVNVVSFLETTLCALYCFIHDTLYRETIEHITIHDGYVKVPYIHEGRVYYTLIPMQVRENQLLFLQNIHDTEHPMYNPIFYNNIIECVVKDSGHADEIDISDVLDRYMGPDQCYKNQTQLIRVRDILPSKFHDTFKYVRILYDTLESSKKLFLDDLIFDNTEKL